MSVSPGDGQATGQRPNPSKRTSPTMEQQPAAAPRKRRARYVWRACDSCRRRKGRCDGRKPCGFCRSRNSDCHYSPENDPEGAFAPPGDFTGNAPASSSMNSIGGISQDEPVSRLVQALQAQLDNLVAHVQSNGDAQPPLDASAVQALPRNSLGYGSLPVTFPPHNLVDPAPTGNLNSNHNPSVTAPPVVPQIASNTSPSAGSPSKTVTRKFFGPTSPDYSLNAAEIKLRQTQGIVGILLPEEETNPSLEDDHSEDEQSGYGADMPGTNSHTTLMNQRLRQCISQLPRFLARNDTLRLINVYRTVVGNLHPVINFKSITEEAEACYSRNPRSVAEFKDIEENTTLLLFLVLAIALTAESVSQSIVGKTLYRSIEPLVKMKLTTDVSGPDDVLVALLAALFHFFNDQIRLAWRTCGIAGRMAMELGLHRKDVLRHVVREESQHAEVKALLWSIVILDRQWSAASGLPQSFQESDFVFEKGMEPPESASYLRSMISYTFMSPKYEVPIYTVAAGASWDQEDGFELLNFQIDLWLRKSVEGQVIYHPDPTQAFGLKSATTTTTAERSATATLLYLRANAFRSIILRPFFMSNAPSHITIKMIKPSMDIVSDSIGVLTLLDADTDVYRNQHPFFQHFLNSSCALLMLVIASVRGDCQRFQLVQSMDLPEPFPDLVKHEVERALALAAAYSELSHRSNRLTKRLRHLESLLAKPDFLRPPVEAAPDKAQAKSSQRNMVDRSNPYNQTNMNNGMGMSMGMNSDVQMQGPMDSMDLMQMTDGFMGDDGLSGMWWNGGGDMLMPAWTDTDLNGHWI